MYNKVAFAEFASKEWDNPLNNPSKSWDRDMGPGTTVRSLVPERKNIGIVMPLTSSSYGPGSGEGLTLSRAKIMLRTHDIGKYVSKIYNLQSGLAELQGQNFLPDPIANERFVLDRHLDYLSSLGLKDSWKIVQLAVGAAPGGELGAVNNIEGNNMLYFMPADLAQKIRKIAKENDTFYIANLLNLLLHEQNHLAGVEGMIKGEQTNEAIQIAYAEYNLKELYSATGISEARKAELAYMIRQMKKISENRFDNVVENYRDYYSSALESMVSKYTKKAIEQGINTKEGVARYVAEQIQRETGKDVGEYLKGEKKGKQKKKAAKKKSAKKKAKAKKRAAAKAA